MAHVHEEVIIIKLSKLVKSPNSVSEPLVTSEVTSTVETLVQELVDESVIVEVEAVSGDEE